MSISSKYENHLHEVEKKWFAIYTQYKREKLVTKYLSKKGIEVYLPINRVVRKWARKVKEVELPLINCYVFVNITKSEYVKVLETENVLNFVQFSGNLISIPSKEIEILKRVTGEIGNIIIAEEVFEEGDEVEIISGKLTGLKGILQTKGNKLFSVSLKSIGYQLAMEIKPSLLKKV